MSRDFIQTHAVVIGEMVNLIEDMITGKSYCWMFFDKDGNRICYENGLTAAEAWQAVVSKHAFLILQGRETITDAPVRYHRAEKWTVADQLADNEHLEDLERLTESPEASRDKETE